MAAYLRGFCLACCWASLLVFASTCSTRADSVPAGVATQRLQQLFPGASKRVLDHSRRLTIFALDPHQRGSFHGYKVTHQRQVTDKALVARVVAALYAGVLDKSASSKQCFSPHHGLRVWDGSKTVDLVICFDCNNIYLHSGPRQGSGPVSTSPEPVFNQALK